MSKNKCGHTGVIARRQRTGTIRCLRVVHRQSTLVPIEVHPENNICRHPTCPFAGKEIPRTEDDSRRPR